MTRVRRAVLILGMHRSGTSALAGCFARLGVALGDHLLQADPADNPEGFYEHQDIVAIHDGILLRHGRTWDDPRPAAHALEHVNTRTELAAALDGIIERDFSRHSLWAVKDPRLCRVLPVWLDLLERRGIEASCCLILRAPDEVAASLEARDGFSDNKAAALWIDHVLGALDCRGRPRAILRFEELLHHPVSTLEDCGRSLDITWPKSPMAVARELGDYVRPSLRHHHESLADPPHGPLMSLARQLWHRLTSNGQPLQPDEREAFANALAEGVGAVSPLALEHLTQVAARLSRDTAWRTDTALREELSRTRERMEALMTGLETRFGGALDKVALEVVAHSNGLVALGQELTRLRGSVQRLDRRLNSGDGRPDQ